MVGLILLITPKAFTDEAHESGRFIIMAKNIYNIDSPAFGVYFYLNQWWDN